MTLSILWLTRKYPYPPAQGGDFIYSRRMIESAARAGARVTVLCAIGDGASFTDADDVAWVAAAAKEGSNLAALFSLLPNRAARFFNEACAARLRQLLAERRWDAVVYDYIAMLAYRPLVEGSPGSPRSVYLAHNHEATTGWVLAKNFRGNPGRKLALILDAVKAVALEGNAVAECDLIGPNTEEDEVKFRHDNPAARYLVLKPGYDGPRTTSRPLGDVGKVAVVLGSYQWGAKRQNLEELLAEAGRHFPQAGIELQVVGFMDDRYKADLIRRFTWANIIGPVDDVSEALARARIGIVAERTGGGFKHKVLNYVFARVTVAALKDAMAGFSLGPGTDYIAAANMAGLCREVVRAMDDSRTLAEMAGRALTICAHDFDWADRGRKLVEWLSRPV